MNKEEIQILDIKNKGLKLTLLKALKIYKEKTKRKKPLRTSELAVLSNMQLLILNYNLYL